jgi:DHA1 family tetracycline resistance protein-like MFS transporter
VEGQVTTQQTSSQLSFERVAPIFALTFVDVLGLTVILPLLHLYGAAFGATPLQIGLIAAAFPMAQLIGVPAMGALSDRFGRKPLLLISQVTTCVSFVMLAFAASLEMVILSRLVDGLFGANLATAQAAISDLTTERDRARGLGLTGAAFGLGFIFGPIISLLSLQLTDSLAVPALTAAAYSFLSILLTAFVFQETLPPDKRRTARRIAVFPRHLLSRPQALVILFILFAEQFIFFGFEALMGVFTLSRLGLLGGGNAFFFLVIGIILVTVQVRYIGRWVRRYGEPRVLTGALVLLGVGLLLVALTPEQPQPFYVRSLVEFDLRAQIPTTTEAILGDLGVELPEEGRNGLGGVLWFLAALFPLSVGAALVRPNANSLLTRFTRGEDYGSILGVSAAVISAANGLSPIVCGLIFQHFGPTVLFGGGGLIVLVLAVLNFTLYRLLPSDHHT